MNKAQQAIKAISDSVFEAGEKTEYHIGGDLYDGGLVFKVFVKGKRVHFEILDGDADFEYKGKTYKDLTGVLNAIGKDYGGLTEKDFKRVHTGR